MIPCKNFLDVDDIAFEATCIWAEPGRTQEEWHAGFQITRINQENMAHLRELIRLLVLD